MNSRIFCFLVFVGGALPAYAQESSVEVYSGRPPCETDVVVSSHRSSIDGASENAPMVLQAVQLWEYGNDEDTEGPLLGVVMGITVDDTGNVYVVDNQLSEVKVLDKDGAFLRIVGSEGEGPGDLRYPVSACITPDNLLNVVMSFPGRIESFRPSGEYVGTTKVSNDSSDISPKVSSMGFSQGRRFAECTEVRYENNLEVVTEYICEINGNGSQGLRLASSRRTNDLTKPVWDGDGKILRRRWALGRNGKVYVAAHPQEYSIDVFNLEGILEFVIRLNYDSRKRSKAERQAIFDWATAIPGSLLPRTEVKIKSFDRDIMELHIGPDGNCWVLSSRGQFDRPSGAIGVFDVFDIYGEFLRQVTIMGDADPYRDRVYFFGSRLYVVKNFLDSILSAADAQEENENLFGSSGPITIVCYELNGL